MREFAKRILPKRVLNWYRRRRALRGYLKDLSKELIDRQLPLDPHEIEGELAAKRQGFYEGLVKDVLERTDLVLQELDRRIAGVSTRHGAELERLREELAELRATVETLAGNPRLGASERRAATGARD
jgi:hypothetical protein